jgi:hypothetical protein
MYFMYSRTWTSDSTDRLNETFSKHDYSALNILLVFSVILGNFHRTLLTLSHLNEIPVSYTKTG